MRWLAKSAKILLVGAALLLTGMTTLTQYDVDYGFETVAVSTVLKDWGGRTRRTAPGLPIGPLTFEITEVDVERPDVFAPALEAFWHGEMERWRTWIQFGPADMRGRRDVELLVSRGRRAARVGYGSVIPVDCKPGAPEGAMCIYTETLPDACDHPFTPRVAAGHVQILRDPTGRLHLSLDLVGFLRADDAARIPLPQGLFGRHEAGALGELLQTWLVPARVDLDADGEGDAWRFHVLAGGWQVPGLPIVGRQCMRLRP
jgi:hypothetical protein